MDTCERGWGHKVICIRGTAGCPLPHPPTDTAVWAEMAESQIQQAIDWATVHNAEPFVAIKALERFLRDFPRPTEH